MLFNVSIVLVVAAIIYNHYCDRTIVYDYEKGLLYKKGKFVGILNAGLYRSFTTTTVIKKVDMRTRFLTVPGQEVLSSDGITLKISLAAQFEVISPELAMTKVENYQEALYLILQLTLRDIIAAEDIEAILQKRTELSVKLSELSLPRAETIGVKLAAVNIKDIMFPGDLKKIFAQELQARKEGLAALEKARGETAALRNLANAAKMVQDNPALLHLRMLESSGNTFVCGLPNTVTPLKNEAR